MQVSDPCTAEAIRPPRPENRNPAVLDIRGFPEIRGTILGGIPIIRAIFNIFGVYIGVPLVLGS